MKDVLQLRVTQSQHPALADQLFELLESYGIEGLGEEDSEGANPSSGLELPDYLENIDLNDSQAVARAETKHMVADYGALILSQNEAFSNESGQVGQLTHLLLPWDSDLENPLPFGEITSSAVHIRNYYLSGRKSVFRLSLISIFDLENDDVDLLIRGLNTASEGGV